MTKAEVSRRNYHHHKNQRIKQNKSLKFGKGCDEKKTFTNLDTLNFNLNKCAVIYIYLSLFLGRFVLVGAEHLDSVCVCGSVVHASVRCQSDWNVSVRETKRALILFQGN